MSSIQQIASAEACLPQEAPKGSVLTIWNHGEVVDTVVARGLVARPEFGCFSLGKRYEACLDDGPGVSEVRLTSEAGTPLQGREQDGVWVERAYFDFAQECWVCKDNGELIKHGKFAGWHRAIRSSCIKRSEEVKQYITVWSDRDPLFIYYRDLASEEEIPEWATEMQDAKLWTVGQEEPMFFIDGKWKCSPYMFYGYH